MKKILKYLLTLVLIIPILVKASSFNDAKIISNNYQSKFLTPDRYLISSTDYWGLDGNIRPIVVRGFTKGGLITQREIEITRKKSTNPMSFSYIYDGTKIWTIENKIVSESFISGSDAKTKVTEYVKSGVTVSGTGTKEDPWIFLDSYKVTVRVKSHGKLQLGEDEPAISKTKEVRSNEPVSFTIKPDSGWAYANHTCGSSAHVTDNVLTFDTIEKDITCEVSLVESRDAVTLPTPCFSVTTKFGTESRCFSNPVKNQFFYRYGLGYFNDKNLTVRVGKFTTKPARTGWTFDGYFVNDTEFVSPSGVYETTYKLIDESHKNIIAKGHANEYTITFDPDAPASELNGAGTTTAKVLYEHDLPDIIRPQRKGYVFEGYFTGKNGTGTQYYNADGSEAKVWTEAANTTLYAKWHICNIDHYCQGNNTEIHCPNGYGTDGAYGTVLCSQCKYWDPCKTGQNTCQYGCDRCCSSYWYSCGKHPCCPYADCGMIQTQYTCTTYCEASSCSDCRCSNCKTGQNTCVADWVYNTSACISSNTYTVVLRQEGVTVEGASMYQATYFGERIVVEPETFAIPTKDGSIFGGYYTQSGGQGTKVVGMASPTLGKVIVKDIVGSGASKSGDAYVLYAHWIQCEKGYYCKDNVSKPCDEGQYQNETGKSTCKPCPGGTFADGKGSPACGNCPFGTYQDEEGKSSCKDCPAGQFQNEEGKKSCKNCVKGSTSSAKSSTCTACTNGKTTSEAGKSTCDANCSNSANAGSWKTPTWNYDNTVTNNCKIDTCPSGYTLSSNQCSANKFTVTYEPNGGSGTTSSHECYYDSSCSLANNGFTRSGYKFLGWKKDNSGNTLSAGTSIKNVVTSGTVKYYAQWQKNNITCRKECDCYGTDLGNGNCDYSTVYYQGETDCYSTYTNSRGVYMCRHIYACCGDDTYSNGYCYKYNQSSCPSGWSQV